MRELFLMLYIYIYMVNLRCHIREAIRWTPFPAQAFCAGVGKGRAPLGRVHERPCLVDCRRHHLPGLCPWPLVSCLPLHRIGGLQVFLGLSGPGLAGCRLLNSVCVLHRSVVPAAPGISGSGPSRDPGHGGDRRGLPCPLVCQFSSSSSPLILDREGCRPSGRTTSCTSTTAWRRNPGMNATSWTSRLAPTGSCSPPTSTSTWRRSRCLP